MKKAGAFFVLGYSGKRPSQVFLELVNQYQVSGLIFFRKNIASPKELASTIKYFRSVCPSLIFFMLDQENGRVNRITKDFPTFPSNGFYGKRKDFQGVKKAYAVTAKELSRLGINVNLAPVLDLSSPDSRSFIKDRSFGKDPLLTAKLGTIAIKAIQNHNLLACAKHFPGLDELEKDPHQTLPIQNKSKIEFEKKEFVPFQSAIKVAVSLIMTTHLFCSDLDRKNSVTFSHNICNNILRKKLGFQGITISDDMFMKGATFQHDLKNACVSAFKAGHDLIILSQNMKKQREVLQFFTKKIQEKKISQRRLDSSWKKIKKLSQKVI